MEALGKRARQAALGLAISSHSQRNQALKHIEEALLQELPALLRTNEEDLSAAQDLGEAMGDRLRLTQKRVEDIREAVADIRRMTDPLGKVLWQDTRPNGLLIRRVSVPLGVLAVIYESRPNVTLDAAAMAIKSGNAVILRGGREAIRSNTALVALVGRSLERAGLSPDCVQLVGDTSRDSAMKLMKLKGHVDLLIPRGGPALIQSALENAQVPVLETGEGVCHIYVDRQADPRMALQIAVNAKCNRPSTCNAVECLLIHQEALPQLLPPMAKALMDRGVELRGDPQARQAVPAMTPATQEDWGREYNALTLAVKTVASLEEALQHIARYGTKHSEAIITQDETARRRFFEAVDAAAVYHNASTRFTDGGEFGFGAEIGISTQKLHCRGPVGVPDLCTYKYLIQGKGQVRS